MKRGSDIIGIEAILNYRRISDTLSTAGQPTAEQLAAVRAAGFELVVNMALSTSPNALPDEGEPVETAWADVLAIWQPDETWQRFVDEAMQAG